MSSRNRVNLIVVFLTFLIMFEIIAYVTTTQRPKEQFFQVHLLGANRLAADYYPNNSSDINLGEPVKWYLGAINFMGSVQLVTIRVKLANHTISPPNDTQALPSTAPMVTEFTRFIQDNETWEIPFIWQISNMSTVEGATHISEFQINNDTYRLQDSSALEGKNFRLIFELWTWNVDTAAFQFGWSTGGERRVAWLQVWFNAAEQR